jgi:large subunit ribosomal protein L7/L12
MAASKEQILESISNMTIMFGHHDTMMEEKFGVTAAAPVAAAAAAAGAAACRGREDRVHGRPEGVPAEEVT